MNETIQECVQPVEIRCLSLLDEFRRDVLQNLVSRVASPKPKLLTPSERAFPGANVAPVELPIAAFARSSVPPAIL